MTTWDAVACIAICIVVAAVSMSIGVLWGIRMSDREIADGDQELNRYWKRQIKERDDYWLKQIRDIRMEWAEIVPINRSRHGR